MAVNSIPTPIVLRQLLRYEPDTGHLYWLDNARNGYAGKEAGTISSHGYRKVFVNYRQYSAHRIAWAIHYGEWPVGHIDHINHDRSDNRISNLRVVTNAENRKNLTRRADNKTGVCGVFWEARTKRWRAQINHDGKRFRLGTFTDKSAAEEARREAERRFGFHHNHGAA